QQQLLSFSEVSTGGITSSADDISGKRKVAKKILTSSKTDAQKEVMKTASTNEECRLSVDAVVAASALPKSSGETEQVQDAHKTRKVSPAFAAEDDPPKAACGGSQDQPSPPKTAPDQDKSGDNDSSEGHYGMEEDEEEDYAHLLQQTPPPHQVIDWLDFEATLVDSPQDRGVMLDEAATCTNNNTERLDFGYFSSGQSLFRNKLNDQELLEDGFVALHQLVLPDCHSALLTSFSGPSIELVTRICWDVPKLLLVGHELHHGSPFSAISLLPDDKSRVRKTGSGDQVSGHPAWYYIACAPFGKYKAHLMHAKLLLFRSAKGLRIVISGNNLTTPQWTEDRDCFWVQDVPVADDTTTDESEAPNPISPATNQAKSFDEPSMTRIKIFLSDLLKSSVAFHNISNRVDQELMEFVTGRLDDLFSNLDDAVVNNNNIRFVFSFPRMFKRGGWQQLCQAVWELRRKELEQREEEIEANKLSDDDLWYDTDDDAESDDFGLKSLHKLHLYASSGSFGDFYPNFLMQMRLAFSGNRGALAKQGDVVDHKNKKKTNQLLSKRLPWSEIKQVYCMWPSKATALMMNPIALLGRCRPMARKHWATLSNDARRSFFDAIPNPDGPSLVSSTESQAAAGFGRSLVPSICGYKLRDGPLSAYTSFAHGKIIFGTTMTEAEIRKGSRLSSSNVDLPYAAVYVGSHNFSKKAWGVLDASPGNVEFGVVLLTSDPSQAARWKSRLPYQLPIQCSAPPNNYRPGRSWDLWERVQQQSEQPDESSVETADSKIEEYL
ncbi:MAG: hypothetical protein SGILL_004479, partial [Bacillariaceae sp.]